MKLLQINAWAGKLGYPLLNLFSEEKPDILCAQEVIDIHGDTGGFFWAIEKMQEVLKTDYTLFSPVFSFPFMRRQADFGNCIMSKFPIREEETIYTYEKYNPNFDINEDEYNVRNMQHVVIVIGKKSLHVLNHHGYHNYHHKNGSGETARQMELISKYIDKLDGPIILAGDFNLKPQSKSLGKINRQLINLSIKYGLKTTRTILTNKREVCDYVFVNDQVKVNKFYASEAIASDHQALVLEFDI
jgi:endonuclease/exonuclease/phosphatase family metal-dependent hydrolase